MNDKKLSPIEEDVAEIERFLSEKNPETMISRRLEPEMDVLRRELEIDGYNMEKALLAYRTASVIQKYHALRYHHLLTGGKDKKLGNKIVALWDQIEEQKAKLELFFRPLRSDGIQVGRELLTVPLPNITSNMENK
ncbi:hypothetical protein [Sigmofec virus UA08Rod_6752]|uniref:Uncharacterized protein n=1 Tax=Sigmofec virus UA08Rod_6752 TaxID=2929239 RepID=A0A976N192_9VIRU|nr:hypothetical protein [Sigmofec virus UA08Rod_6752]